MMAMLVGKTMRARTWRSTDGEGTRWFVQSPKGISFIIIQYSGLAAVSFTRPNKVSSNMKAIRFIAMLRGRRRSLTALKRPKKQAPNKCKILSSTQVSEMLARLKRQEDSHEILKKKV
jgi:hypothetical protein